MPNVKQKRQIHLLHHVEKGRETVRESDEGQKEFLYTSALT